MMETHIFYCTQCGNPGIPLPRKNAKKREAGHLKNLYCPSCKKVNNACEISSAYTTEDFFIEFNHGNFNSLGQRKVESKKFIKEFKQNG